LHLQEEKTWHRVYIFFTQTHLQIPSSDHPDTPCVAAASALPGQPNGRLAGYAGRFLTQAMAISVNPLFRIDKKTEYIPKFNQKHYLLFLYTTS
jgi:hypothetical protein